MAGQETKTMKEEFEQEENFNNPLIVTEVFRVPVAEAVQRQQEPDSSELITGELRSAPEVQVSAKEYGFRLSFGWEDVRAVGEYAYPDDWTAFKGPKHTILLAGKNNEILVLGDFEEMIKRWTAFRNKYPLYKPYGEE